MRRFFVDLGPWQAKLAQLQATVADLQLRNDLLRAEVETAVTGLYDAKKTYEENLVRCAQVINQRLERQRELYAARDILRLTQKTLDKTKQP